MALRSKSFTVYHKCNFDEVNYKKKKGRLALFMPEEWIFVLLLSRLVWPVSLIIHCVRDVFSVTRILEIRSPEVFFFLTCLSRLPQKRTVDVFFFTFSSIYVLCASVLKNWRFA